MTDKRITDLPEIINPANDDMLVAVDTSDTTSSPEGTTKKVSIETLFNKSNFFGWANYRDSQYTSSVPLSIPNGVRTQLTNNTNGSTTEETYLNDIAPLWSNNSFTPVAVGDAYDIRLSFKAKPSGSEKILTLDLDIGDGSIIKVYEETRMMLKGAGNENSFVFAIPIYCLDTFITNGGRFYITTNDAITVYDINIMITKTYRKL